MRPGTMENIMLWHTCLHPAHAIAERPGTEHLWCTNAFRAGYQASPVDGVSLRFLQNIAFGEPDEVKERGHSLQ